MVNKAEVIREAGRLTKAEMKDFLKTKYGIPPGKFKAIMGEILPRESDYQTAIIEWLNSEYPDAFIWKAAAGPYCRGGIPDVCAIIHGHFYGFEVKRPYIGKPTELQKQTILKINNAGGMAAVVCFPKDCKEVIDKHEAQIHSQKEA